MAPRNGPAAGILKVLLIVLLGHVFIHDRAVADDVSPATTATD